MREDGPESVVGLLEILIFSGISIHAQRSSSKSRPEAEGFGRSAALRVLHFLFSRQKIIREMNLCKFFFCFFFADALICMGGGRGMDFRDNFDGRISTYKQSCPENLRA